MRSPSYRWSFRMPRSSRRPRASSDRYGRGGERTTRHRGPAAARRPQVPRPRRRHPGPGQARNTVLHAAVRPADAWPRPFHGAWWDAYRLGRSDQKTRADAWNCGACRNSIGSSGIACSADVKDDGERLIEPDCSHCDRRAARPRSGGEDRRLWCKAISRRPIPRAFRPQPQVTMAEPPVTVSRRHSR